MKTWWTPLAFAFASCAASSDVMPAPSNPRELPPPYTADGKVLGVERGSPTDPVTHVQLVLQPGDGKPVRIDLGPGWYLDERGLRFQKDDRVEIEGRPEQRGGENVIVARRVRKGGVTVELGDGAAPARGR